MEKTTLYLSEGLAGLLRDAARREGRPQAEIVREALAAYLEGARPEPPRSIGLGRDAEVRGSESEGWLEDHL